MTLHYTERFLRTLKKLPRHIKEDTFRALDRLQNPSEREPLHVYPLEGRLRGLSAITINFAYQAIALMKDGNIIMLDATQRAKE